jgi:peptidoglycan/LPS O-acetylase OafA/YrhL
MVLLLHAPELIDGNRQYEPFWFMFRQNLSFGGIAVAGFFILSGYLISKNWLSDPDAVQFMNKRIRRIYPGFIVTWLVCSLSVGPLGVLTF